jgi:hypothetical protein
MRCRALSTKGEGMIIMISNLTIANEVEAAIYKGDRTLKAIRRRTKRNDDQIGDALACLIIAAGTVRSEVRKGTRLYFPARRKRGAFSDAPLSFSALPGLWPTPHAFRC